MEQARGMLMLLAAGVAFYRGWKIHTGREALLAFGLGLAALGLKSEVRESTCMLFGAPKEQKQVLHVAVKRSVQDDNSNKHEELRVGKSP